MVWHITFGFNRNRFSFSRTFLHSLPHRCKAIRQMRYICNFLHATWHKFFFRFYFAILTAIDMRLLEFFSALLYISFKLGLYVKYMLWHIELKFHHNWDILTHIIDKNKLSSFFCIHGLLNDLNLSYLEHTYAWSTSFPVEFCHFWAILAFLWQNNSVIPAVPNRRFNQHCLFPQIRNLSHSTEIKFTESAHRFNT